MLDKKCCLNNCCATIGDCLNNPTCGCLICLGTNQENCAILKNEHTFKAQQIICEGCRNCKDNMKQR